MADRDEWMRRLGPLYPGAVAIRQTTAMRWPGELRTTADDSQRSAPWVVIVGAVLGLIAWTAGWLVGEVGVAPALQGALAVVTLTVLSAALLDVGLARTVERWLGKGDEGGFGPAGTSALLAAALLRLVAIIAIRPSAWLAALVIAPLIGRWSALSLQRLGDVLEPPTSERRSLVVGGVTWLQVGLVTVLIAATAVFGLGWSALLILAAAAVLTFVAGLAVERGRGGLDGHSLAAVAAVCELVALVGVAAIAPAVASAWTL